MSKKEKAKYLPRDTVLEKLKKYKFRKGNNPKGAIDRMKLENATIVALYFFNTAIARNDYWEMKIANKNKDKKTLEKKYNYLLMDTKTFTPVELVFQNYKTKKLYGIQSFSITPELREYLKLYLEVFDKKAGDYLFTTKTKNQYNGSNFGKRIQEAFEAVTGTNMGVQNIRQYLAIWFNSEPLSIAMKKPFDSSKFP